MVHVSLISGRLQKETDKGDNETTSANSPRNSVPMTLPRRVTATLPGVWNAPASPSGGFSHWSHSTDVVPLRLRDSLPIRDLRNWVRFESRSVLIQLFSIFICLHSAVPGFHCPARFLVVGEALLSSCGAQTSHCGASSCSGARASECGFSSCGT